ncbi:MAG: dockerin type I repeat-containing protein [candidate division Zixibacteria bacterium]
MKRQFYINIVTVAAFVFPVAVADSVAGDKSKEPIRVKVTTVKKIKDTAQPTTQDKIQPSTPLLSPTEPESGEQIKWQVISSGSGKSTSTTYTLIGTAGQTAVGFGSSTSYDLNHGFWKESGESPAPYICGDANGDDYVNVGDAVFIINHVFKGGPAPDPVCSGDANDDDGVNVGDAVYLINHVFKGGDPPREPCCP